jgi:hypothetical protein
MSDGGYVWYQDQSMVQAMDQTVGGRDQEDAGYKPRNDDPWWVILVAVTVMLAGVAVAAAVVIAAMQIN